MLCDTVLNAIKPVYEDLSSDDLLNRCIGGYTQNNNESFNSVVWSIAPKTISSSKTIVDIAADIAVCTFNSGMMSILCIMKTLGLIIGTNCYNFCVEADSQRIAAAERSLTDKVKQARRQAKSFRKEEEDQNNNLEGQLYGAGIAD